MKWKKISVDQDRKIKYTENFDDFQQCLTNIDEQNSTNVMFQREKSDTPIKSYGVILALFNENGIKYFTCQRRTTIEFAEMVKSGPVQSRLFEYLSNMTPTERDLILKYDHEILWNDLLLGDAKLLTKTFEYVNPIYKKYVKYFPKLIGYTTTQREEPPWEFPKGRFKKGDRTLIASAIRELKEECNIVLEEIELLSESVDDLFRGTDGQLYQTTYFIVKAEYEYEPRDEFLDPKNVISKRYISDDMRSFDWIELDMKAHQKRGSTNLCERLENLLFSIHKKLCK